MQLAFSDVPQSEINCKSSSFRIQGKIFASGQVKGEEWNLAIAEFFVISTEMTRMVFAPVTQ